MSACPQELGSCHPQRLPPIVVGHDVHCTGGGHCHPGEDFDPPLLGQTQSSWTATGAGVMTPRGSTLLSVTKSPSPLRILPQRPAMLISLLPSPPRLILCSLCIARIYRAFDTTSLESRQSSSPPWSPSTSSVGTISAFQARSIPVPTRHRQVRLIPILPTPPGGTHSPSTARVGRHLGRRSRRGGRGGSRPPRAIRR
jgi:hypothetical protein